MRTRYEKLRIPVSRLASAIAVFFLLFSTNRWETGNEAVTTGLFTLGMFLVAIGSLGRMWCSLYIAGYKDQVLITQGPYSATRNPLYFFSTFGALGVGFCTETFTFPLLLLGVMILYYPLVVRKEERRLRARFGGDFDGFSGDLGGSFARYGFAVISDHDLPQARIEAALAATKAFFALPEEIKRGYVVGVGGQRGYTPFGIETAKDAQHFDLKEFWHMGRDLPAGHVLGPEDLAGKCPGTGLTPMAHDAVAGCRLLAKVRQDEPVACRHVPWKQMRRDPFSRALDLEVDLGIPKDVWDRFFEVYARPTET